MPGVDSVSPVSAEFLPRVITLSSESLIKAGLQLSYLASTAGEAPHPSARWQIESHIPISTAVLVETLLGRDECTPAQHASLKRVFSIMSDLLHHRNRPLHTGFAAKYADLDPDLDHRPRSATSSGDRLNVDSARVVEFGRAVLHDAGYREVDRSELEQAVNYASEWGVPLYVDFDLFDLLLVYSRGDVLDTREKRQWKRLFRKTPLEVPIYQRVVLIFKLRDEFENEDGLRPGCLHLRLFKNVPKADLDMLLPGARIRLSWLERTRSIAPSLGGLGVQLYKLIRLALFVAVITYSIAAMIIGLTLAIIGYLIRSVLNYWQTKNRYMLHLTRSLYYQKLDTNAGVAFRLLHEAESQRHREVILCYFVALFAEEPLSIRKLRRRVERLIREMSGTEVEYRAQAAVDMLTTWNLIVPMADDKLQVVAPELAIQRMDAYWDNAIQTGQAGRTTEPTSQPSSAEKPDSM